MCYLINTWRDKEIKEKEVIRILTLLYARIIYMKFSYHITMLTFLLYGILYVYLVLFLIKIKISTFLIKNIYIKNLDKYIIHITAWGKKEEKKNKYKYNKWYNIIRT